MVNVLIVDDQRTARQILEYAVSKGEKYSLVRSIENAALAEMYCARGEVDLVLMDVYTAHRENGLEAAAKIKKSYPGINIIIVTSLPEHSFIQKAREAGCESFSYKDVGEESLLSVMDRIMAGESVYPGAAPVLRIGKAKSLEFTKRELEVLREKANGCSNQEICKRFHIKKSTLDYHMNNILSKTGYPNTVRLTMDVVEQKFIIPDFSKKNMPRRSYGRRGIYLK